MSADALTFEDFLAAFERYFRLGGEQLEPGTRLHEDLSFDSLAMYELVLLLEDLADFEDPIELIDGLRTLDDVYRSVAANTGRHQSPRA